MESLVGNLQKVKLGLHIAQSVFSFVAFAIEIAYFRNSTFIGSSTSWYFAMCFLSIPAIIYQTMTARFPRSRKFANPYAFAAIDVVYTILWLSAFAALAAFNTAGLCIGACQLSAALVGLGFMIFLFWGLTSAISVYGVIYYRRNGSLPGSRMPNNAALIDPDREAFDIAPHGEEYAPVQMNESDMHEHTSELSGGHPYDADSYGGYVPPRRGSSPYSLHDSGVYSPPPVVYAPPQVSENTSYEGAAGAQRVQFPSGNYS